MPSTNPPCRARAAVRDVPRKSLRQSVRQTFVLTALVVLALTLPGCMDHFPPDPVQGGKTQPRLADRPQEADTVRGVGDPAVVTLPMGDRLKERPVTEGDPLPSKPRVEHLNLNAVPVTAALQALVSGTNISLSWEQGEFDDQLVTILNLSGSLDQVIDRVCAAGHVYCLYQNGTLRVLEKQTFIIEMPPIAGDASNSIADAIGMLAGDSAKVDKDGGNIIYTTDAEGQMRVQQYLQQLRRGRPLIVMQLYIWEVRLDDSANAGIKWDGINLNSFGIGNVNVKPISNSGNLTGVTSATQLDTASAAAAAGGANFGAVFSGAVNATTLLSFLRTNGTVETVSNPQMTFVSGTKSEFSIGGKQNYVSGVGQLVGTSTTTGGTSNNTGIGQNTVQTDTVETGINVKVNGAYESGVIFGQMDIQDTTLLGFDNVNSSGTTLQLPKTQERKLSTIIRLRPGDTLLLAGLRSTDDNNTLTGTPTGLFGMLPFSSTRTTQNREMVIMLRPAIIRFSDTNGPDRVEPIHAREATPEAPAAAGQPGTATINDAVAVAPPATEKPLHKKPEATDDAAAAAPVADVPAETPAPAPVEAPAAPTPPVVSTKASAIDEDGKISADRLQRALQDVAPPPAANAAAGAQP